MQDKCCVISVCFQGESEYFTAIGGLIVKDVKNKEKVSRDIALTTLNSKKHIISQRFIDMECSLHTQRARLTFNFICLTGMTTVKTFLQKAVIHKTY